MNTRATNLLEGSIFKSLVAIAVPIVLANILQTAYQLTDAFWVGRLGGAAVAAVSVSFPLIFLSISLGAGFAIAGSTLIAQYAGARNERMVNHVASQTLLMSVVVSAVLSCVGFFVTPFILHLMGVAGDVYEHALGFMRVSFFGLVFTFGFFMFQSIMRGIGEVTMPMYIVLGTVILNFGLDPLFIFGWGPIAGHGVIGAALATLGTQGIATITGLIMLLNGRYGIHLHAIDFKPDITFIKKAFLLGFPASVEQSARALGLTVMTFLITSFGTVAVAAYGVGSNILQFVIIPALGFSMAISALVGQNIGAQNIERASRIARLGAIISFSLLTGIGVVAWVCAPYLIAFFVPNDPEIIRIGAQFVRIISLTFGFIGLQMALTGVFRAAGNMVLTMMLAIISQWVFQFPLAYILSKHTMLGLAGLWWAFPVSNVLIALITIALYMKGDWKRMRLTEAEQFAEQTTKEILIEEGVRR